ncbi:MAG: glycosyltransferase family 39 protein [Lewinella sp.]
MAVLSAIYLPVEAWDEARRGGNAFEMLQRGDYLNYYYLGQPDTFNTKPPLYLWAVAKSFDLFGVNKFALRLPSLLSLLALLLYFRWWLAERFDPDTVLLTIGATVASNGLIGYHVAISGDTDMLFVFLLSVGCLAYYSFLEAKHDASLITAVLSMGLAFLTKGVATALVLPGLLTFTLSSRKYRQIITSRHAGMGLRFGVAALMGAFLLLTYMGRDTFPRGGPENLFVATFFRDGLQRLTDPTFESGAQPWFVFQALDIRFGPLIYLVYASIPLLLWKFGPRGVWQRWKRHPFAVYSFCVTASVLLLLHLSSNKHNWYLAPSIPFLAFLFAACVRASVRSRMVYRWLTVGLVLLAIVQRGMTIYGAPTDTLSPEMAERLTDAREIYVDGHLPQDEVFRLYSVIPLDCRVDILSAAPTENPGDCFMLSERRICVR